MSSRAQIQMTETIAVIFIFFILLFFGMIFYYKYVDVSIEAQREENLERRAIDITNKVLFLPEIQCTARWLSAKNYCLDLLKLQAFQKVLSQDEETKNNKAPENNEAQNNEDYYFNIFSFARITVQEIYPDATKSWVVYDKPKKYDPPRKDLPPGKKMYTSTALQDDEVQQDGESAVNFGMLTVEVYS